MPPVFFARASLAGLPSLAQGGDRIRSLGGPAIARTRAIRRGASRARRPDGSPSEVTKFRRNERGSPAGPARAGQSAGESSTRGLFWGLA